MCTLFLRFQYLPFVLFDRFPLCRQNMNSGRRICKLESTFKAMERRGGVPDSTHKPSSHLQVRHLAGALESAKNKSVEDANAALRRKQEKAEKLVHLICWGPNW